MTFASNVTVRSRTFPANRLAAEFGMLVKGLGFGQELGVVLLAALLLVESVT